MVTVYAPASVGNVGVGFDVLGIAICPIDGSLLGDRISIHDSNVFDFKNTGRFFDQLPVELEQNVVFQCWERFYKIVGSQRGSASVSIRLEKNVPVASGLGSSACSIVSALVAMNLHYGAPLNKQQLLSLMGEIEGNISGSVHFDNVSPCFLGGVRLVLQKCDIISQKIPNFDDWLWIVAYPGTKISTIKSRSVLPNVYSRKDCISHSQFLSGFVHACHTKQECLAIRCMQDIIAEPYRSKLLPLELSYIRNVLMEKGALSCGISGSGPTIFVLCKGESIANDLSCWLSNFYLQNDLGFVQICSIDNNGARLIEE